MLSEAIPPERGGIGDVSGRNHPCLLRDDSLRETVNGGCCPGVSLRSTARLNLDFSYRKSWGMRGGRPSRRPYGYAVMAWCGAVDLTATRWELGVGRSLLQLRGDVGGCGSKPRAAVEDTKRRGALMTVSKIFA